MSPDPSWIPALRALESLPQPVMLLDRDLRGLYTNPAMCALMGRSAAELIGTRPDEMSPPEQGAEFVRLLERTRDERLVQRVRLKLPAANGRLRIYDVKYVPLMSTDGAVEALLGIGDDVTESALAEERIQRLSRIYRALSGANEAIVRTQDEEDLFQRVCDAALELGDLRAVTVLVIEREAQMLRYQAASGPAAGVLRGRALSLGPETPAGKFPVLDAVRIGRPVVRNSIDLDASLECQTDIRPETGIRAAAGFPLRRGGEIVGGLAIGSGTPGYFDDEVVHLLASMAQDISFGLDHLARARALQSSEERYRSLVDNMDDVVFEADERGKITFVSRAIARYGQAPEDVVGRTLDAFANPADVPTLRLRWAEAKAGQRAIFEIRSMDGRGKMRTMRVLARPLFESGAFTGIQGVITDLTEKHEMEEQLRTSQKMEAVGRLAGGVAHDFNNLLTVILSSTDFALEALPPGDPARADIEEARKASTRAVGLTRQLLAFSRKQMLRPEVLDLNGLVAGLEKMLRRLLGEDIELVFYPGANLGAVKADAGQIEQVLMNLAVNARDAMPRGGRLAIRTENAAVDDEYAGRHLGMRPGSYVKIAVRDTGTGMDEVTLARIFEPFFTTKAAGKGTGLGLATVYGIVKQSNGHIWVTSRPGEGATFEIFLPLDRSARRKSDPRDGDKRPPRGHETILLVEDEEPVRRLTQRILFTAGYEVVPAGSGAEALQALTSRPRVDLLLTDVVMPGMNGRELWARLQKLQPDLKVLYMSGYTDDALADRGAAAPGALLVGKPFSADVLLQQVRAALDG